MTDATAALPVQKEAPDMPTLITSDSSHLLSLGDDENRFSPAWMTAFDAALDHVCAEAKPLIITGDGKFFSNGLDLEWIMGNLSELDSYTTRVHHVLRRVLTLPVPTVAAINGHAFGAGAMLAMACDWRVMREDRGYFCFPEIDINIPFTPGMAALIQSKLAPQAAVASMTTGRRFTGAEAAAVGIVGVTAGADDLLAVAGGIVEPLGGKSTDTLGKIKTTMFAGAVAALIGAQ